MELDNRCPFCGGKSIGNIPDNFQKINVAELMKSYPKLLWIKFPKSIQSAFTT